jgi:DNA-binding transcriptional MerR regulator
MADDPATADDQAVYQIGDVAERVGLSLRTIRHYEDVGVIAQTGRTRGGYRLYTERDVDRLRKVKGMKPMGFTLGEISDVLELLDQVESSTASPRTFERLQMFAALAVERRDKLRERLALATEFTDLIASVARRSSPDER